MEKMMKKNTKENKRDKEKGFTMVELLVVLVILGLLVGIVGPKVVGYLGSAKSKTARVQVEQLGMALDLYLVDMGRYPSQEEGLSALVRAPSDAEFWNGPYLSKKQVPMDPWGHDFYYVMPGQDSDYDLYTLGADNSQGGEGQDADIYR